MAWGARTGCHQMPERSFFFKGYQLPLCARCTGVVVGYAAALILVWFYRPSWLILAITCGVMLLDWSLQALGWLPSTQPRRLASGMLGGYGLLSLQLKLLFLLVNF